MRAVIFLGPNNYNIDELYQMKPDDFLIGADQGALLLAQNETPFHLAIGDFDSVTKKDRTLIDQYASEVLSYPSRKDYTDSHLALLEAQKRKYDEILFVGGIGNRFDHSLVNMYLLQLGNVSMISPSNYMYVLSPGIHQLSNNYDYISFFAVEDVSKLSLTGFMFELANIDLKIGDPLCISNQGSGTVEFTLGKLLVIHQNE